jgi:IS5 family transposase
MPATREDANVDDIDALILAGQRRRVTETIKRDLPRQSALEPVIGRAEANRRMGRNYLAGQAGDAANAVLAATG